MVDFMQNALPKEAFSVPTMLAEKTLKNLMPKLVRGSIFIKISKTVFEILVSFLTKK